MNGASDWMRAGPLRLAPLFWIPYNAQKGPPSPGGLLPCDVRYRLLRRRYSRFLTVPFLVLWSGRVNFNSSV
jgi:hypothetical protein